MQSETNSNVAMTSGAASEYDTAFQLACLSDGARLLILDYCETFLTGSPDPAMLAKYFANLGDLIEERIFRAGCERFQISRDIRRRFPSHARHVAGEPLE